MAFVGHVIGRVGRDPETHPTQGGLEIITWSVASSDGQKKDDTSWHECKIFVKPDQAWLGQKAKALRKGSKVIVFGRQKDDKFIDKTSGQQRVKKVIYVSSFDEIATMERTAPQEPAQPAYDVTKLDFGDIPF